MLQVEPEEGWRNPWEGDKFLIRRRIYELERQVLGVTVTRFQEILNSSDDVQNSAHIMQLLPAPHFQVFCDLILAALQLKRISHLV